MRLPAISKFALCALCAVALSPAAVRASGTPAPQERLGPVKPMAGVSLGDLSDGYMLNGGVSANSDEWLLAQAEEVPAGDGADVLGYKPKSPKRAFLQSFFVPGWGQWYTGNRWKPFLFLGMEAAGWLSWSNFRSKGDDFEIEYQAFADSFWTYDRYQDGLQVVFQISIDTMQYGTLKNREFSHHVYPIAPDTLPVKNQTYYENIGKYDQFAFGWDDLPEVTGPADTVTMSIVTPHRKEYLSKRDDANREFNKASTVLILTIGNHLLSAFEAAWSAKRYNRAIDQFGKVDTDFRLTQSETSGKLMTRFAVRYHF